MDDIDLGGDSGFAKGSGFGEEDDLVGGRSQMLAGIAAGRSTADAG